MKETDKFLSKIPGWISSKVSIFIYLLLFFYLVVFAAICMAVPALNVLTPSENTQLILGNYTNVLSALGASIAAGSGVAMHGKIRLLRNGHQKLQETLDELNQTVEKLSATHNQK